MQTFAITQPAVSDGRGRKHYAGAVVIVVAALLAATAVPRDVPAWAEMWLIAGVLFAAFKTLTWGGRSRLCPAVSMGRTLGYLFGWIGLDANEFCAATAVDIRPRASEWVAGVVKTLLGGWLLWGLVRIVPAEHPVVVRAFG